MGKDLPRFEYAEESIKNVSVLVKALSHILLNREFIRKDELAAMLEEHVGPLTDFYFLGIPITCSKCGRKSTLRFGDMRRCSYCDADLSVNLADFRPDGGANFPDPSSLFA